MAKDLVGPSGADINKKESVYIEIDNNSQVRVSIKKEAFNATLRTALGYKDTPIASRKVYKETHKEAIKDHGCLPITLEYQDGDLIKYAKVIAAPSTKLEDLIGQKYHGTLDIVGASFGH